jgi:hypothetical protein
MKRVRPVSGAPLDEEGVGISDNLRYIFHTVHPILEKKNIYYFSSKNNYILLIGKISAVPAKSEKNIIQLKKQFYYNSSCVGLR